MFCVCVSGLQGLEAGNLPAALSLLQAAASGFCSKRVLAQIYTCIGCCTQQMVTSWHLSPCSTGQGGYKSQCLHRPKESD